MKPVGACTNIVFLGLSSGHGCAVLVHGVPAIYVENRVTNLSTASDIQWQPRPSQFRSRSKSAIRTRKSLTIACKQHEQWISSARLSLACKLMGIAGNIEHVLIQLVVAVASMLVYLFAF